MTPTNLLALAFLTFTPYLGQKGQPRFAAAFSAPRAAEVVLQIQTGTNTWKDYMLTISRAGTNNVITWDKPTNTWALYRLRMK